MSRLEPHREELLRRAALRGALAILACYHLLVGVLSWAAPQVSLRLGGWLYAVAPEHADAAVLIYLLKALGMYALFTGSLLTAAFLQPERHRVIAGAAAGLLILRAITRVACYSTLASAFSVPWERNVVNVLLLVAQASALIWGLGLGRGAARRADAALAREARRTLDRVSQRLTAPAAQPRFATASTRGV